MKSPFSIPNHRGAALISLLAAVLLFSVLAAAIVPMLSSSNLQSVSGSLSGNAYMLAESGYRYAASQFLHAEDSSEQKQNEALENLDGTYTLKNNGGKFSLQVFSYFYELTSPVDGDTEFTAHAPGNFPGDLLDDEGDRVELNSDLKIRIGGIKPSYELVSGSEPPVDGFDDRVSFNVKLPLASFPAGTPIYPVADVNTVENTSISEGDSLEYEAGDAAMFPLRNGFFQINGRTLTYRFNDRDNNQFIDVRAAVPPALNNFDLTADPEIVLTRYVRLHSTGIYGSDEMQAQRQVVYYTPLPPSESNAQQAEYSDPFDNTQNWSDTAKPPQSIDGDNAMKINISDSGIDQTGGLTTFSPDPGSGSATAINFGASFRGTRGFLSYDTQIKVGYENYPVSSVPPYVGAGLSFRLGSDAGLFNTTGYGLSILRGNNNSAEDDGIPDALVPLQDERALVLWRQPGDGNQQRTWLAYKRLADLLLDEDDAPFLDEGNETVGSNTFEPMESPSIWRVGAAERQRTDSLGNWSFIPTDVTPSRDSGGIRTTVSNPLPAASNIFLTFWSWHDAEPVNATRQIRIINPPEPDKTHTIDGANPPVVITGPAEGWYQYKIDLTTYAGDTIDIQFLFDSVDLVSGAYEGWYLDDMQLVTQWTGDDLHEATIALGLKEAMVVPFVNGDAQIRQRDKIYGDSGTTGRVLVPPLISSGTWETLDAVGVLLLNSTSGPPLSIGDDLFVNGNTGHAVVSNLWNETTHTKANIIQVYLATKNGRGTGGNTNPLDRNTEPYGRIGLESTVLATLQWPPILDGNENWTIDGNALTQSKDYFQLIEWDAINPDASGLVVHPFRSADQGVVARATLQSYHKGLITPDYPGIYNASEVGLHSMGNGAEDVFFDDFGIRLNVFETDVLPTPLQQ